MPPQPASSFADLTIHLGGRFHSDHLLTDNLLLGLECSSANSAQGQGVLWIWIGMWAWGARKLTTGVGGVSLTPLASRCLAPGFASRLGVRLQLKKRAKVLLTAAKGRRRLAAGIRGTEER
jgi:hypothetical protein